MIIFFSKDVPGRFFPYSKHAVYEILRLFPHTPHNLGCDHSRTKIIIRIFDEKNVCNKDRFRVDFSLERHTRPARLFKTLM